MRLPAALAPDRLGRGRSQGAGRSCPGDRRRGGGAGSSTTPANCPRGVGGGPVPTASPRRCAVVDALRPLLRVSSAAWRSWAPSAGVTVVDDFRPPPHRCGREVSRRPCARRYPGRRLVSPSSSPGASPPAGSFFHQAYLRCLLPGPPGAPGAGFPRTTAWRTADRLDTAPALVDESRRTPASPPRALDRTSTRSSKPTVAEGPPRRRGWSPCPPAPSKACRGRSSKHWPLGAELGTKSPWPATGDHASPAARSLSSRINSSNGVSRRRLAIGPPAKAPRGARPTISLPWTSTPRVFASWRILSKACWRRYAGSRPDSC